MPTHNMNDIFNKMITLINKKNIHHCSIIAFLTEFIVVSVHLSLRDSIEGKYRDTK